MRDSVSFWVFDDRGEFGLPRVGIEAVADELGSAFGAGQRRVSRRPGVPAARRGTSLPAAGADGRPTRAGRGSAGVHLREREFDAWTMTFEGKRVQTSSADLVAGRKSGPLVDMAFDVGQRWRCRRGFRARMRGRCGRVSYKTSIAGDLMGGPRYEQLFRATGSLIVDGREQTFSGSGLRIRRQGVRKLEGFWGHCWQSALFPSGRAFGYIAYPPRPDGEPNFNEGYCLLRQRRADPGPGRRGTVVAAAAASG